jgi:DNA repair photolyase
MKLKLSEYGLFKENGEKIPIESEYDIFESDHDDKFNYTGSLYSDCDSDCEYCEDRKKYDRR